MEEIEKYLSGKMEKEAQRLFEQKMASDPDLQTEVYLREGLKHLRLQKKIEEIAATRRHIMKVRRRKRILIIAAFVGLLGLVVFLFFKNQNAVPNQKTLSNPEMPAEKKDQTNELSPQSEKDQIAPSVIEKNKAENQKPIAEVAPENKPASPFFPAPTVRGENDIDEKSKATLDQIWYTDYSSSQLEFGANYKEIDELLKARNFENAYVRLQRLERKIPPSDTLRFLKGYCLMEMGEGAASLSYFENLEERQPDWRPKLEWFRGLSLILAGEKEKALVQFRKIIAEKGHPYSKHSERAVQLLRK
ncbi:MAG TPA: hypothetical protein PKC40_10225 [Saprospiraceae bacterium]|nr:hypothetical protein [Saprospiraceae bacterium]